MMNDTDPFAINRGRFEKEENKNVFVIMRYGPDVPFKEIESTIKDTLQRYGLKAVLARDVAFYQQLWNTVRFCMTHSRYAIVVFERIQQPDFNPNVVLELGYMLAMQRPCLILKEQSLPTLSTDIIGHLYTPFDSHRVRETVGVAIEDWLKRLGHSSIKPAEIITADTLLEANKERTRVIITELSRIGSGPAIDRPDRIVRQAASLSSLAISEKEIPEGDEDEEYKELLLQERRRMEHLLEDGAIVRIIICPDIQLSRVRLGLFNRAFVESNILPRYEQLIKSLRKYLSASNLHIAFSHKLPHDNFLLVGESIALIGRKRLRERGFPQTTIVYDPAIIRDGAQDFDAQFHEVIGVILKVDDPKPEDYGSEALKLKVIERLRESQREVKRFLGGLHSE